MALKRWGGGLLAFIMICSLWTGCGMGEFDAAKPVEVVSREDGSGTRSAFIELLGIEEKTENSRKDRTTKRAVIVDQTDIMITKVAMNPHMIGYISLGSFSDTVKAVKVDGVELSAATVKDGSYPVSRQFVLATKGELSVLAKDFLNYILSAEGQAVVERNGYIAVDDQAEGFVGEKPAGKLVVEGSSSVTPVMEKLREAYVVLNPNAEITIQKNDSSTGLKSALAGTCDIAMSSRDLKESESGELRPWVMALDGIAIVVNRKNPLLSLSSEQVKDLFTGAVQTWEGVLP